MHSQPKRVTLYTTRTCPWCVVAKRYLAEHGVDFAEVDITSDRSGMREMVLMTAQHGVPVLRIGEKAMVGWNAGEFERLFTS